MTPMTGSGGPPRAGEAIDMSQTSGVNPSLYTNTKRTPKRKPGKK